MQEFQLFLHKNLWNGTHLRRQIKKYALLTRRMGGSFSKTFQELAQAWNMEEGKYWVRDRNVRRVIAKYGNEEQRTDAWHAARATMITASEVGSVVEGAPAARHEVMMRKLAPRTSEPRNGNFLTSPLIWGTVLEPIAKRVYEEETHCAIQDVSCVRHPVHSFLGASPDGIIKAPTDRERHHCLVEFKCPKSRKIGGEIPKDYVHQMQMQMACTGVDECEYAEFQFQVVYYPEWKDCVTQKKGILVMYDSGKIEEWNKEPDAVEDGTLIYWILRGVHRDLVLRDPTWLPGHLPKLKAFWDEVVQHQEARTLPEKPGILKLEL